jgi:N-acetylglucosaminyldiphosphoundecaprenol N-acetyl-beta-D-mannosaminyltransferase
MLILSILQEKLRSTWDPKIPKSCSFLNPFSYLLMRNRHELNDLDFLYLDGLFLVKTLGLIGLKAKRRSFDMTSLAPIVFTKAVELKWQIVLVGSHQELVEQASRQFQNRFQSLQIIEVRNGYFKGSEQESYIRHLVSIAPDVILVGMGTPYQEIFLSQLKKAGFKGHSFSCGGFFHQSASGVQYYPGWIDRLNLRWLYRMWDEPKLIKRYAIDYPKFLFYFFFDSLIYLKKK